MQKLKLPLRFSFSVMVLSLVLLGVQMGCDSDGNQVHPQPLPAEIIDPATVLYFPIIHHVAAAPLQVTGAGTRNITGVPQNVFFLWDTIEYVASGINNLSQPVNVALSWTLAGPCDTGQVFSETVSLPPGTWEHTFRATTPGCNGAFTATLAVNYLGEVSTLTPAYVVNLEQAFDRCGLPTVSQMQTWWDASPYTVWNIYLGGIHFPCSLANLTPSWVQSVSQQGWDFILTWVGPQAPCSNFYYRFSSNWVTAYFQGAAEAEDAITKARDLGIQEDIIIYYDLEAYIVPDGDTTCRYAAAKFMQGWTEALHGKGVLGGGYGSPCNSYMTDWYNYNLPPSTPPDDVWIAHWLLPAQYRPDASVWNVACMTNSYWPNHQRLRQYAGDHVETWGGVAFTIDSSVVDGETVTLPAPVTTSSTVLDQLAGSVPAETDFSAGEASLLSAELISDGMGWVLTTEGLLRTEDGGNQWQDITPPSESGTILAVDFLDPASGWAVASQLGIHNQVELKVFRTQDGGDAWEGVALPGPQEGISQAYLHFIDPQTGWLVLKKESGSSFSLGRLFATQDGGLTWEERAAPMAEPVVFVDEDRGWMAGGPAGDGFYRTSDGGLTWEVQQLPGLPAGTVFVDHPRFTTPEEGILPVTILAQPQSSLVIYASADGGETWQIAQQVALPAGYEPGRPVPFNIQAGTWRVTTLDVAGLTILEGSGSAGLPAGVITAGLPEGIIGLGFASAEHGWALVQQSSCTGDKVPGYRPGAEPFTCRTNTQLFSTQDGGFQWVEINPLP